MFSERYLVLTACFCKHDCGAASFVCSYSLSLSVQRDDGTRSQTLRQRPHHRWRKTFYHAGKITDIVRHFAMLHCTAAPAHLMIPAGAHGLEPTGLSMMSRVSPWTNSLRKKVPSRLLLLSGLNCEKHSTYILLTPVCDRFNFSETLSKFPLRARRSTRILSAVKQEYLKFST